MAAIKKHTPVEFVAMSKDGSRFYHVKGFAGAAHTTPQTVATALAPGVTVHFAKLSASRQAFSKGENVDDTPKSGLWDGHFHVSNRLKMEYILNEDGETFQVVQPWKLFLVRPEDAGVTMKARTRSGRGRGRSGSRKKKKKSSSVRRASRSRSRSRSRR